MFWAVFRKVFEPCGSPPETGRSISISSSFSFRVVRARERAGEAKLRVGVSEAIPLSLGLRIRSFVSLFLLGCLVFVRRRVGFKDFCFQIDGSEARFCAQARGFQDSLAVFFSIFDGIRVGFKRFFLKIDGSEAISCEAV